MKQRKSQCCVTCQSVIRWCLRNFIANPVISSLPDFTLSYVSSPHRHATLPVKMIRRDLNIESCTSRDWRFIYCDSYTLASWTLGLSHAAQSSRIGPIHTMATKRKAAAISGNNEDDDPIDPSDELIFLGLGGCQEVGRSCHILQYKGKTVMVRKMGKDRHESCWWWK